MDGWSILLGGLIGLLTTHAYYKFASRDTTRELARLAAQLRGRNTPEDFHLALRRSTWSAHYIGQAHIWTCDDNATFQIEVGDDDRPFDEPWSRGFPDRNTTRYSVYLKIGEATFKQLTFVSLDGGRINVPIPKQVTIDDAVTYVWDPNEVAFAVGRIIGTFYIYEDIERVARRCRIEILRETPLDR